MGEMQKISMRFRCRFKYEYAALPYFKIKLSIRFNISFFFPMVVSIVSSCVKKPNTAHEDKSFFFFLQCKLNGSSPTDCTVVKAV